MKKPTRSEETLVHEHVITAVLPAAEMKIEMWPIDRLIPYPKNARKWSAQAIVKVAASLKKFGWRQPLVVDAQDVIIIGHLRQAAARYLGQEFVPVHVASDLTAEEVKALRIADNRTHEEATWDTKLLGAEMIDLKVADFDLNITAFEPAEIIESIFGGFGGAGGNKKNPPSPPTGEVPDFEAVSEAEQGRLDQAKRQCPKCGHEYFEA